jgi:hypothetical protein
MMFFLTGSFHSHTNGSFPFFQANNGYNDDVYNPETNFAKCLLFVDFKDKISVCIDIVYRKEAFEAQTHGCFRDASPLKG